MDSVECSEKEWGGVPESNLWLDQNGETGIRVLRSNDQINVSQEEKLGQFLAEGYMSFQTSIQTETFDQLRKEIDTVWATRPIDLAYRFLDEPHSMADAVERRERMAPCRLLDVQSHSEVIRKIYLNAEIFGWVELILGKRPIAYESVFTEFGRAESPIRDVAFVDAEPPCSFVTAWVALEDITLESGPVFVVPGSHRLPVYQFSEGRFLIQPGEDYLPAHRFGLQHTAERGLSDLLLLNKRGEVTLWHPAMIHGARRVLKPWATRRSLLIRFFAEGHFRARRASYWKMVPGQWWKKERRLFWKESERILELDSCRGFDNPLRGLSPRGLSFWGKLRSRLTG